MHHPKFPKLEGTWRGLHYLVMNSETGTSAQDPVLNVPKRELSRDLQRAVEFDQSQLFKKIYENEFGTPGGEPYGALIGDYEWTQPPGRHRDAAPDVERRGGGVRAVHLGGRRRACSASTDWTELAKPRDLAKIFETLEYAKWRSFRDSEDARFVTLVMPRVLARLPYGAATKPIDEFALRGSAVRRAGAAKADAARRLLLDERGLRAWARELTDAFAKYGFCAAIRGAEGGGKVEDLPAHVFTTDDGDLDAKCPTEIGITDRRESELSNLGFLPLCHYKNTDYAVFFGAQIAQKPKKYDRPEATANAAISARLPYIMATCRFAHYLKVMARDKIGSFMEASDVERWLNRWINNYVNANENAGPGDEGALSRCARHGRGAGRSRASPAPTTRSPICGRGCRWRS